MTSFSKRGGVGNLDLIKSQPHTTKNTIGEFDSTPLFFNEYRLMRKGLTNDHSLCNVPFDLNKVSDFTTTYKLNPYYDINGVGLIYFTAYPVISDLCESRYFNNLGKVHQWETEFKTISRDIFYYANCNLTDRIIYKLNQYEFYSDNKVKISCTLYRQSDGTAMANIFTLKEGQERKKNYDRQSV